MRKVWLGSLSALFAGAGLSLAQPAPAVLASPAPKGHATGAALPLDLPPTGDARSTAQVFPVPGTAVYDTPGAAADLPPYDEPVQQDPASKKECDRPHWHYWASADPLLWWVKPGQTPPLVAAAGDGPLDYGLLVGGRVAAGAVGPYGQLGVEAGGFWLERGTTHYTAASGPDGSPALGRPVVDALTGQPLLFPVSSPGVLAGALTVTSSSQLWGAETNLVSNAFGGDCFAVDVLGGVRYVGLDESLAVAQTGTSLAGAGGFSVNDSFRTRNQFVGGQLGSQVEVRLGRLYTNLLGKVAVGNVHQIVDVRGDTALSGAGSVPAGFLALGPNSGRQTQDTFGVVPELNFNVGYQLRPCLRLYAGYTFLYLNDVARPGDQVGTTVNTALVPASPTFGTPGGAALPGPVFNRTDYWAQGVNIGLALRY